MKSRQLFNNNWHFAKLPLDTEINKILDNSDITYTPVDIPHDFLIHQVNNLYESVLGVYKKVFTVNKATDTLYSLCFEGVYFNCKIIINKEEVFEWKYGYSTFEFDITDYLSDKENTIYVLVYHEAPNSRWYSGAGIYRNIYICEDDLCHIKHNSVYFSAKKEGYKYNAYILAEIVNADINTYISYSIQDPSNGNIIYATDKIAANINRKQLINNLDVHEWSADNPYCYLLTTSLYKDEKLIDSVNTTIGFRDIRYTPDGLYINGEKTKLNGVCLHHDLGCLGAAVNREALRRQLISMKEMGVNAIRTSHNMPAVEFMELCDELGLYVNSEAFDIWQLKKNEYDYARFFDDWYERDVESWITRDRNHPSIIMWSIGNEIYDTHSNQEAPKLTATLRDLVLKFDPMMNGRVTIGSNYIPWEGAQKCADELKLSGYNYCENLYEEHHEKFPDHIIYGSETAARVQSRGIYHFPITTAVKTCVDLQCSSLENSRSGCGDRSPEDTIIWDRDTDFSCGHFIWTGSDYIGEPTPYKTKNSYYGQIDTAGLRKDSFYLYQSSWSDQKVLHLFPYWDFNEGQIIDVCAYTNLPFVELFFNEVSYGIIPIDIKHGKRLMATWQIPYSYGEIKAIAYDSNMKPVLSDSHHSFKDSARIILKPTKKILKANGIDMTFIEISTVDENGYPVENARDRVFVNVEGPARLVGLDNGDSTDYEEYKGISKKLFSGKLVAYIMSTEDTGIANVTVSANGLDTVALAIECVESEKIPGVSCIEQNRNTTKEELINQIPIRNIKLSCDRLTLDNEHPTGIVNATVLPANATNKDIVFEAVTLTGVKSGIVELSSNNNTCCLNALGDGTFILRCMAYNDKDNPEVLSELLYSITDMGDASINPYSFVYGTIYNDANYTPGEDLEGGISPISGGYVGFYKCDFGKNGAGKFKLPIIYWFSEEPLHVSVWSGRPNEETSILLGKADYKHEFVWQTYFDLEIETIPVTGIHDIYFDFSLDEGAQEQRISFKGFICDCINNAYKEIQATSAERIYGDSYIIEKDSVREIGNNVSLEFDEMDFSESFSSITVCGKTKNQLDSIHIFFIDDSGRQRRMIEFEQSEDYIEKTFSLEGLKGKYKVTFMFLPGACFDFKWFRFNKKQTPR